MAADRFEAETEAFFAKVRAGYLELAKREPHRIRIIDASVDLSGVEAQVIRVMEDLL
jgi:dTMP kinase